VEFVMPFTVKQEVLEGHCAICLKMIVI
jgi:hypothetical protein